MTLTYTWFSWKAWSKALALQQHSRRLRGYLLREHGRPSRGGGRVPHRSEPCHEVLNQSEDDVDFWLKALLHLAQRLMAGASFGTYQGPGDVGAQAAWSLGDMTDPYRRSIQTLLVEDGEGESWFSRAPFESSNVVRGRATRVLPMPVQRFLKCLWK